MNRNLRWGVYIRSTDGSDGWDIAAAFMLYSAAIEYGVKINMEAKGILEAKVFDLDSFTQTVNSDKVIKVDFSKKHRVA